MFSFSCGTKNLQKIPNIKVRKDVGNGLTRAGRSGSSCNKLDAYMKRRTKSVYSKIQRSVYKS
jgi:hypothetical protein